jgi:hypothetical protein
MAARQSRPSCSAKIRISFPGQHMGIHGDGVHLHHREKSPAQNISAAACHDVDRIGILSGDQKGSLFGEPKIIRQEIEMDRVWRRIAVQRDFPDFVIRPLADKEPLASGVISAPLAPENCCADMGDQPPNGVHFRTSPMAVPFSMDRR